MAVANAKMVFFFGGKKWGWTETWYWSSSTVAFDGALADAALYVKLRREFLSAMFSLEAARVELCDDDGSTFVVGASLIGYNVVGGGPGKLVAACSNPWMSLLCRFYGTGAEYAKNMQLRGIPDELLCINEGYRIPYTVDPKLKVSLDSFLSIIVSNPEAKPGPLKRLGDFCARAVDKPNGKGAQVDVVGVKVGDTGHWVIDTLAPITYVKVGGQIQSAIGDTIHLHNFRGPWAKGLNGQAVIIDKDLLTYTINKKPLNACTVDYNFKGSAWGVRYLLAPMVRSEKSRIDVRKTGGPFFGTRGRRRARA